MTRWLLLGGLALAIWLGLEVMVSRVRSRLRGEPPLPALRILGRLLFGGGRSSPSPPSGGPAIRLVRCAACGQHVPENRARRSPRSGSTSTSWFCWPECNRDAGASAR